MLKSPICLLSSSHRRTHVVIQITYWLLKDTVAFKGVFKSLNLSMDARNTKKIYQVGLHHKRPKGRPVARWKDDVENDGR
jgi:hypothetical protein